MKTIAMEDANLAIGRRIFMTATPQVYNANVKKAMHATKETAWSMDDPELFGRVVYDLTVGEAIDRGLISDYEIEVGLIDDTDAAVAVENKRVMYSDQGNTTDARNLARVMRRK